MFTEPVIRQMISEAIGETMTRLQERIDMKIFSVKAWQISEFLGENRVEILNEIVKDASRGRVRGWNKASVEAMTSEERERVLSMINWRIDNDLRNLQRRKLSQERKERKAIAKLKRTKKG